MAEETVEIIIDKEGPLQFYQKKKWKTKWGVLSGGGLYYKSKQKETDLVGPIALKGSKIEATDEFKKKSAFKITLENGSDHFCCTEDDTKRKEWIAALEKNKEKDVGSQGTGKKKQSAAMRVQKSVGGTVATSGAGKGIIKDFLGKEGVRLIEIIKKVITIYEGKKKATEIENNIIKVGVKVILLWKNKDISTKDISGTIPGVKAVWSDTIDFCEMSFAYDPSKVKQHGEELLESFKKLLASNMTDKNLQKMEDTIRYVVKEEVLDVLFRDEKQEELKKELLAILRGAWIKVWKDATQ